MPYIIDTSTDRKPLEVSEIQALLADYIQKHVKIEGLKADLRILEEAQEAVGEKLSWDVPETFVCEHNCIIYKFTMDVEEGGVYAIEPIASFIDAGIDAVE